MALPGALGPVSRARGRRSTRCDPCCTPLRSTATTPDLVISPWMRSRNFRRGRGALVESERLHEIGLGRTDECGQLHEVDGMRTVEGVRFASTQPPLGPFTVMPATIRASRLSSSRLVTILISLGSRAPARQQRSLLEIEKLVGRRCPLGHQGGLLALADVRLPHASLLALFLRRVRRSCASCSAMYAARASRAKADTVMLAGDSDAPHRPSCRARGTTLAATWPISLTPPTATGVLCLTQVRGLGSCGAVTR